MGVPVHEIKLNDSICKNLPAYHVLTGCDTVSQFCGLGKKSTWAIFQRHADLLDDLGVCIITNSTMAKVEKFVCRLYNVNQSDTSINDIHYKLFLKGGKDPGKLPPTQLSLQEHVKRAHYQSLVWYSSNIPQPNIYSPVDH